MKKPNIDDYPLKIDGKLHYYNNDMKKYIAFIEAENEQLRLNGVSRSLPTSTQILSDCKNSFKDLEGKGNLDYRSYQNGYLKSFSKYVIEPSDNG